MRRRGNTVVLMMSAAGALLALVFYSKRFLDCYSIVSARHHCSLDTVSNNALFTLVFVLR